MPVLTMTKLNPIRVNSFKITETLQMTESRIDI